MARPWREMVAVTVGKLLWASALFSLFCIPFRGHGTQWLVIVRDVFGILNIPSEPSLFVVVLLAVLAGAVRRRLRLGHGVMLVMMALSVLDQIIWLLALITHTERGPAFTGMHGPASWYADLRANIAVNIGLLIFQVLILVLFAASRRSFPARLAHGSRRAAAAVVAVGLAMSFAVTLFLTICFPRTLDSWQLRLWWSVRSVFGVTTSRADLPFNGALGHHFIYVLAGFMSASALVLGLLVLVRGGRGLTHQDDAEELAVRRLLLEYGENDSLGYFATRRDKSVIFAPDGQAVVTYRVEGSVSVASADPIGRRPSWDGAIAAWLEECRRNGWYAAVLSSSQEGSEAYVQAGLRAFSLGDEAIIDVDDFDIEGAEMAAVRQAVRRVERAGYEHRVRRYSELKPDELAELQQLADDWRGEETERGFSMALNRVGDPADQRCVVITAHDPTGQIRGFLSFVPWGLRGLSLDLMRRDRTAPNGLNEYMVTMLVQAAPGIGVRRISLNFAVFRNVFSAADQVGAGPITRLTDAVLSFASRFYQLETLYRSNDKYRPRWVPRLLCYDPALTVARAGIAMGVAEGFLPLVGPSVLVGPKVDTRQPPRPDPAFVAAVQALDDEFATPRVPQRRRPEQQQVRERKLEALAAAGREVHPVAVAPSVPIAEVVAGAQGLSADTVTDETVTVVGRVRALRDFGGVSFAVLKDGDDLIQVVVDAARAPTQERHWWHAGVDLGDLVQVTGQVGTSRSGEISVFLRSWTMVAKALIPVPPLGVELADDTRVRNRSLDLIVHPDAVRILRQRSQIVSALRATLNGDGFMEVETPMLQAVHGGATARPFVTHINAYRTDLFLRIAPELFLKRLAVGGMSRIYELNRNFRNEGADATHNPEFTSLEAYEAYSDYHGMADLAVELIRAGAIAAHGRPVALRPAPDGGHVEVDLSGPWRRITVHDAVSEAVGRPVTTSTGVEELRALMRERNIEIDPTVGAGKLVMALYEELVEAVTKEPTFYFDFPREVTPLARPHRHDPHLVEQWDLVAWGAEIGTAYSELTDAAEQRRRLTEQSMRAAAGDPEAMEIDEEFLAALELGMPPTGGLGLGVDRVVMMLIGTTIRPTLAFPFVRPKS